MKKRILSLFLAVVMLVTMLPVTAFASSPTPTPSSFQLFVYTFENGSQTSGYFTDSCSLPIYGGMDVDFAYTDTNGDTTWLAPAQLSLPSFLSAGTSNNNGQTCIHLHAEAAGEGDITYTDANGVTHKVHIGTRMPDMGLYTGMPFDGTTLVEHITLSDTNNVFYIALSPERAQYNKMAQVNSVFGSEVTGTSVTEIGTVELSADGTYAKVTVTDLEAQGHHHFEATIVDKNTGNHAGTWGRSIHIESDFPGLYFCNIGKKGSPTNYDFENPRDNMNNTVGNGPVGSFFFGKRSDIAAGKAAALPVSALTFPAYVTVTPVTNSDMPANVVEVEFSRFANANESEKITYTVDNKTYSLSAKADMPPVACATQPTLTENSYIYSNNPLKVSDTNRTFYITSRDLTQMKIESIFGWDKPEYADMFNVTPSADGTYLTLTVKDGVIVPDDSVMATVNVLVREDGDQWRREKRSVILALENNQPTLMWRYLMRDDATQTWYEDPRSTLQSTMSLPCGSASPVVFRYGTAKSSVIVDISKLTWSDNAVVLFESEGCLHVKAVGYEETGVITYTDAAAGITAQIPVTTLSPDHGIYSALPATKATYCGSEVAVDDTSDMFYLVANREPYLKGIQSIMRAETGENVTSKFSITLDPNGRYAEIRSATNDLPMGGAYNMVLDTAWGRRWFQFDLVRADLTPLDMPTELTWHREYAYGETDVSRYADRMGNMSFKAEDLFQNHYRIEVYSAADGYANSVTGATWRTGDMQNLKYISSSTFIYDDLPSGTYKFRICALGDGTKYRNSAWSELSPAFEYTAPASRLMPPDASKFEWSREFERYNGSWVSTGEDGVGYYEINWYYEDPQTGEWRQTGGNFDIRAEYVGEDGCYYSSIHDDELQAHGNTRYTFIVRAIPKDITQYALSQWTKVEQGPVLDLTDKTTQINSTLTDLTKQESATGQKPTVEDVQNALEKDTAELRAAMTADQALQGGNNSGTLDLITELEQTVANHVDTTVELRDSAVPQPIKDIVDDIQMVGAALNFADDQPDTGNTPTVTLEIDVPKQGIVIPEQMHNAIQFSMKLKGAVNYVNEDDDMAGMKSQKLAVPVVIDLPVPKGINPMFLVVLHQCADGIVEQIWPHVYTDANNVVRATFVIDSFSDFAFAEYIPGDLPAPDLPAPTVTHPVVAKAFGSGTVRLSVSAALPGETVLFTAIPDAGCDLTSLEVTANGRRIDIRSDFGRYSFTMPDGPVTITACFDQILAANTYSDVHGGTYYYDAVRWALGKGVLINTTGKFGPDKGTTRGAMVEYIWRAAGCPEPVGKLQFTDVKANASYAKAVQWAVEQGITTGRTAAKFDPDATVSRAEAMTFLWRLAGQPRLGLGGFTDVKADAYYAYAVNWAITAGITNGMTLTTFGPDIGCTNAHIITFLYRYLGK